MTYLPVSWKKARRLIIILLTGVWEKEELSYVHGRAVWQLSIKIMTPTIQVLKIYYTDKIIHPCISVCSAIVIEALFVEAKDGKYPSVQ